MKRSLCLYALFVVTTGCGLGAFEDESGGQNNLPTRGAGPYLKTQVDFDTPADEPFILYNQTEHYSDPMGLLGSDGQLRIWFSRRSIDSLESDIAYAELPDVYSLVSRGPEQAMAADADWEQGAVAEPSIIDVGGGHLVMFYRGGIDDKAIGRADSQDGGESWTKHPDNPVLSGADQPAAAQLADEILLYFTDPLVPGIHLASSDDGVNFERLAEPVIEHRPQTFGAFDLRGVADPFAVVTEPRTEAGRPHLGMFFAGTDPGPEGPVISIGYAGSFDGRTFSRFLDTEPILARPAPSEAGPAAVLQPASGILLFHEAKQSRFRIAAAVHP